jgi:hypothetical protein
MKIVDVPVKFLASKGVKNPKYVVYGTLAVLAVIGGVIIYRKVKGLQGGKWTSASTQNRLEDELGDLSTGGATISQGDAIIIAQNLLNAMDRWGTDEAAIIENLGRCKNKADLNLVIQTFGIKPYDGTGLADTFFSRQLAGVMKNLNGWLRQELGGKDLEKVKEIYSNLNVPF